MRPIHHPSDLLLAEYAAGSLDEASALIVSAHLALCPHCRRAVADFECIGGALLEQVGGGGFDTQRRGQAVTAISADLSQQPVPRRDLSVADSIEAMIDVYGRGPWRWIGPGVYHRRIDLEDNGVRAFMLRGAPGTELPDHSHSGTELTLVLKGEFSHELGRFGVGDMEEADGGIRHAPRIGNEECICLVAMVGTIRLRGLLGRLIQPFVRL